MKKIEGNVWEFGDDISTDLIISGKYKFETLDMSKLSEHAMEGADPDFSEKVNEGDIIVAGENFGCGSSREQAPLVLKELGIGAIISKFFARIFYRNAINQGIPVLTYEGIQEKFETGNKIEVDWKEGLIKNTSTGKKFNAEPLPSLLQEIIDAGSILEKLKKKQ